MNIPHTYNPMKTGACSCGEQEAHPIHPHTPRQVAKGRCTCGAPVDAICHITRRTT